MNDNRFLIVLVSVALGSCMDTENTSTPSATEDVQNSLPKKTMELEQDMPRDTAKPVGKVELPRVMLAPAITDLANRLGVGESDIHVLRATAVTWNNGAAGCPQPGVEYTQVLTPGFWAVLGHNNERYSYHATRKGKLQICANTLPDPSGEPPYGRLNQDI